jgi:hypothetical protein
MEQRPSDLEGRCQRNEEAAADKGYLVVFQVGGFGVELINPHLKIALLLNI